MPQAHPLALRILASIGAGSATAALFVGGGATTTLQTGCCPPPEDTGPYDATLGENCTVRLDSSFEALVEQCEAVSGDVCPPFDQVESSFTLLCGPLRPGEPVVVGPSSSTGGAGGAGGSGGLGGSGGSGGSGGLGGSGGGSGGSGTVVGAGGSLGSGGGVGDGGSGGTAPVGPQVLCCYGALEGAPTGYGCGRPLLIEGVAITSTATCRDDWSRRPLAAVDLSAGIRAELAERWARDAALEHASIASFARFVLDLLSVGAPVDLVRGAERAMKDEIDHAERCYAIASRYAGHPIGPGPLQLSGAVAGDGLANVASRALVEGCIGETIAAIVAARSLEVATDPEARDALAVIARDEAAHAELAFRFVAWAARDGEVRASLRRQLPSLLASSPLPSPSSSSDDDPLEAHGQPSDALRARAAREALDQVIAPCLSALLSARASEPALS